MIGTDWHYLRFQAISTKAVEKKRISKKHLVMPVEDLS